MWKCQNERIILANLFKIKIQIYSLLCIPTTPISYEPKLQYIIISFVKMSFYEVDIVCISKMTKIHIKQTEMIQKYEQFDILFPFCSIIRQQ